MISLIKRGQQRQYFSKRNRTQDLYSPKNNKKMLSLPSLPSRIHNFNREWDIGSARLNDHSRQRTRFGSR